MTRPARPTKSAARKPTLAQSAAGVVAHPLFPLITGVWFAALFGLGAVAAGGEALASLVGHLHLTTILPSAAPPLGTTAHILIASGLTALGAGFGLVLGLVLHARAAGASPFALSRIKAGLDRARTAKPRETARDVPPDTTPTPRIRNRDAHPDAPPRRPLVVTEDVLPYHAPDAGIAAAREAAVPGAPVTTPPAWTAQIIDTDGVPDPDETPLGGFMTGHPATDAEQQPDEVPPFFAGALGETPPLAPSGLYGSGDAIVLPPETGEPADLAHAQPAPSPDAEPAFALAKPAPLASQAAAAPHEPIVDAPVASLGLVQLIERLALAISARQALQAGHAVPVPGFANDRADAHADQPDAPLLRTKPARLGRVDDAPIAAADPVDDLLPPRFLRAPAGPHPAAPADASLVEAPIVASEDTFVAPPSIFGALRTEADPAEPSYSSLANMTLVRPGLSARLADGAGDPVVQFPVPAGDHAAPAPARGVTDDADRALRDALATLRRMSAQR